MNSFCVGLFAVLAMFAGTAFSKVSQDEFYEMFRNRVPMEQILPAVCDNCPTVQLQHMQAVQQHIDNGDDFATYATNLKKAAQKILNGHLREMGHEPVDIMEYMQAASDMVSGKPLQNPELENVIKQCLENRQRLAEASDEEKQSHLNKMIEAANANDEENTYGDEDQDQDQDQDVLQHESIQLSQPHPAEVEDDEDNFSQEQVAGRHDSAQRRIRYTSPQAEEESSEN
ncbi:uncharacterized protein LOC135848058 [Planococcus citri]|uniref:uncharacterized protein LOC135848058 n=1 Tax=Planococcus citri TaxID=170843 RepID=UPI0031FA412E